MTIKRTPLKADTNNPRRAGELAGNWRVFGAFSRFKVAPVHTRFKRVSWFVWDAEKVDEETGLSSIVRQAPSEAEAVAGLS